MATLTQGYLQGEFLLSEANGGRSRETVTVTISGGVALPSGTVLGKVTATGKYVAYSNAASNGSETAAAVLYTELPGTNGDHAAAVIVRDAEVINAALNGGAGVDTAGRADLLALGVIVR